MYFTGNIKRRPLRTFTIILTVALAISINISLSSLSTGLSISARGMIEDIGMDLLVLPKGTSPLLAEMTTMDWGRRIAEGIENVEHVIAVSPRYLNYLFVKTPGGNYTEIPVYGVIPEREENFTQFSLERGVFFKNKGDAGLDAGEVLLSRTLMEKLEVNLGGVVSFSIPLFEGRWINHTFTVSGVFTDVLHRDSKEAIIHLGALQNISGVQREDTISEILVKLDSEGARDDVKRYIEEEFEYRGTVTVYTMEDVYEDVYRFIEIIDNFSLIIYVLTTSISLVIFSTIFLINLLERREEIGVLNVLGIPRTQISLYILGEGMVYAIFGFLTAVMFSWVFMRLFSEVVQRYFWDLPHGFVLFSSSLPSLLTFLLLCLAIAFFSTLPGLVYLLKKSPVELIRGEAV
ncbi:MAG: ABC transporter permease [Thermoplasmata archaeon]|nr:ABC transporter permease [Thermoplasmata archaeon]